MKALCKTLLRWFGWKSILEVDIPDKCILCVAPHTSNWDFFLGKTYYASVGRKPYFLMKKEWFFFPLGYLIKAIGGFPVNRTKKSSLTEQMIEVFNSRTEFQLAVAPEGTRKKTMHWKSGFYYIALGAKVPIALAHIDYEKKELGIDELFYPTGNKDEDMLYIKNHYKHFKGKHPELFTVE